MSSQVIPVTATPPGSASAPLSLAAEPSLREVNTPSSKPPAKTLVWQPESIARRGVLSQLFEREQSFEVEVGSGDGGFLIPYAKAHPDTNFLGIERLLGRLRKVNRKGLRAGLHNLRLLRLEAGYSVDYLLPARSVAAMHVYFPDPWPKRRHRQRRLINARFVAAASRALAPGGRLYLRTDDADYFTQMCEVCGSCTELRLGETPADLAAFITDFERHFRADGITTLRLAYERL